MDFALSPKVQELQKQVSQFMNDYVYPIEKQVEEEMSVPGKEHVEPQILKDVLLGVHQLNHGAVGEIAMLLIAAANWQALNVIPGQARR